MGAGVAKQSGGSDDGDLRTLLGNVAQDAKRLVSQQIELLRAEVGQEMRQAGTAAASVAGGGGLAVAGGLLTGFAAAQLIHAATGLPLWMCYGMAAGGLGAAAVALLKSGRDGFADLKPFPHTTAALGENVEWLADRLTPAQ